jgi:hypothetical protein
VLDGERRAAGWVRRRYSRRRVSTNVQFLVAFGLGAGTGTLVLFHATRNGIKHPSVWASFVFFALAVGLPSYVIHVRRTQRRRAGG